MVVAANVWGRLAPMRASTMEVFSMCERMLWKTVCGLHEEVCEHDSINAEVLQQGIKR